MDDAEPVRFRERGAHRADYARGLLERLLVLLADDVRQRAAVHVLANLQRHAFGILRPEVTEVVNAQRVRMREARQRECFLDEVLVARATDAGVTAEAGKDLDADGTAQPLVVAFEHDAVTAGTNLLDDLVAVEHHVPNFDFRSLRRRRLGRAGHCQSVTPVRGSGC